MSNVIIPAGFGTILDADGKTVERVGSREITFEEAKLLREYKKFLMKYELREALYCNQCWQHDLSDGCEAHVTQDDVLIKCRCQIRFYKGSTL